MIEIELFDGTVLEFPPGTDPAVIDRAAKMETATRRTAQPATQARVANADAQALAMMQEEPSLIDTIMGYGQSGLERAGYYGQEAARGATNVLGAPADLINISPMLLNILPGEQGMTPFSENPVGGSQMLWDALTAPRDAVQGAAGLPQGDAQPKDAVDRVVGRVFNEIGAAAPIVGGLATAGARAGTQGARAMQGSASRGQRVAGRAIEPFAVDPAKAIGRETGYAVAAGSGAGLAREAYSDGDPNTTTGGEALADILGALGGAGAYAGAQTVGRAATDTYRAVTGSGNQDIVNAAVAEALANASSAPVTPSGARDTSGLATALSQPRRISELVPGFRETTADVLRDDAGIASLEYGRKTGGPNAGLYLGRRRENAAAADETMRGIAPQASPNEFRAPLERGADDALLRAQTESFMADQVAEEAAGALTPAMSSEGRGAAVRGGLEEALETARTQEREAWSGVAGEVDMAPFASAFDNITGSLTTAGRLALDDARKYLDIPSSLLPEEDAAPGASSVLDAYGRPMPRPAPPPRGTSVDLSEITDLRSALGAAAREASAAGDSNKARVLGQYIDAIDMELDAIPELGPALEQARAVSRDLNDRFTRRGTPTADVLATRPSGGTVVPDSDVPRRFLSDDMGQSGNVDRLFAELENSTDPATVESVKTALREQMVADIQSRGLIEKPDQLNAYLNRYSTVFQRFPDLEQQVSQAADLRGQARAASTQFDDTARQLEPGASRAPVAQYRRFDDTDPARSMETVINSDRPAEAVQELLRVSGDTPEIREGLRASFWSALEKRARPVTMTNRGADGSDPWNFTRVVRALEDPKFRQTAETIYADQPEHLENLRQISAALRDADVSDTARARMSSGTPQGLAGSEILPSVETLGSRSFAVARGQVGLPFAAFNIASVIARRAILRGRKNEFEQLLDQALLNPQLAADLTRKYNPADVAAFSRSVQSVLGVRSAWLDDLLADDAEGEDDEVMNAIMGGR